jgi:hypothetical protein
MRLVDHHEIEMPDAEPPLASGRLVDQSHHGRIGRHIHLLLRHEIDRGRRRQVALKGVDRLSHEGHAIGQEQYALRGFIPYWNREVYASYSDWARWFWKGAVHIDDVAAAVILSLDLISKQRLTQQLILTLDSAYEYTHADLDHWDADGAGSTFKKYYPEYYDLALSYGLDPALKPTRLDISETVRWLGYKPSYSLASLLSELAAYGDRGPPQLAEA